MMAYQHLLAALCELSGQDATGLEGGALRVEIGGREASVLPALTAHGAEAVEMAVSVGVLAAADQWDEVDALILLHRVNAAGWPRHGWLVGLDEGEAIVLRRVMALQGVTPSDLESAVAEGMDRAATLQGLLSEVLGPADEIGSLPSAADHSSMIRG